MSTIEIILSQTEFVALAAEERRSFALGIKCGLIQKFEGGSIEG